MELVQFALVLTLCIHLFVVFHFCLRLQSVVVVVVVVFVLLLLVLRLQGVVVVVFVLRLSVLRLQVVVVVVFVLLLLVLRVVLWLVCGLCCGCRVWCCALSCCRSLGWLNVIAVSCGCSLCSW